MIGHAMKYRNNYSVVFPQFLGFLVFSTSYHAIIAYYNYKNNGEFYNRRKSAIYDDDFKRIKFSNLLM